VRLVAALGIGAISLILVACAGATSTPTPTSTQVGNATSSQPVSVTPPPESAAAVDAALQAAATHLGVSPDQLQVTLVEPHQWPDASLGCPQPGQMYSQVVTPGYLVMITSGGHQLEYHTDMRGRVTLCHET
jgi:hypothetical protein